MHKFAHVPPIQRFTSNSFALRFGFLTTILGMIWLGIMAYWLYDYKTNAGKMQMKILDNHAQGIGAGF